MKGNSYFIAAGALLTLSLAIGGAGQDFPLLEMVLNLAALAVAAHLIWLPRHKDLTVLSRCALGLALGAILLPALQLVPLPPAAWSALPGRGIPVHVDEILGIAAWRPVTLDVERTVRALLSLLPAVAMFFACLHLKASDRARLFMLVAAFALVDAVLGIAQLATGGSMTPFPSAHIGFPLGLFVNRNHNAVFLLLSVPIIAALAARRSQSADFRLPYVAGTLALLSILAVVTIATTSRMALALLPVALAGSLALLFFRQSIWRIAVPSTLVLGIVAATISWVGGLDRSLSRFSSLHDSRFDYWTDVSWALHHYGLAGTGLGSFIPVYQTAESLSSVSPAILNHAHNDYIEIVLEGGVPAIALLLIFFALLAAAAARLLRGRFDFNRASLSLAAALGIAMVLVFSLVDYPLRMPAISVPFALLCACLLPSPERRDRGTGAIAVSGSPRVSGTGVFAPARVAASAAIGGLAILAVQAGGSAASLNSDRFATARLWAPWSTAAHDGIAAAALAESRPAEAAREAYIALRLSPIDASAVRTAAVARTLAGSGADGERLMQIAATLGWRDPFTQLWAIQASERTGEADKAVERSEALFRQHLFLRSAIVLVLKDAPGGPVARSLVKSLAARPEWRRAFIEAAATLPPADVRRTSSLAERLDQGPAPLSAGEKRPLLDRLLEIDDIEEARRLWAGGRRGFISNGGFEALSSRNGADVPSDWDISDEDLATVAIHVPQFGGHARALRISAAARSGPIISQRLILRAGSYSLSYRARSGPGGAVTLRWRLRCAKSDWTAVSQQPPAPDSAWRQFRWQFTVPIQDCPIQRLALERPDDIHSREIWVDDVILTDWPR